MLRQIIMVIGGLCILSAGIGCARRVTYSDGMQRLRGEYFRWLPVLKESANSSCVVHEFTRDIWRKDFLGDMRLSPEILDEITNRCQRVFILYAGSSTSAERVIETASFGPMDFPCSRAEVAQVQWPIPSNLLDCTVYYFLEVPPGRSSVEAVFILPPLTNRVLVFGIKSSG